MKRSLLALVGLASITVPAAEAAGLVALIELGAGFQGLTQFDSSNTGLTLGSSVISGLGVGERLLGIDFRPLNGLLYGLSSGSSIYTVNVSTGAASKVGSNFTTLLNGASYGFDFNPSIDRIRVVGDSDQNLVINPDTGAVQLAATNVFYRAGDVNAGADANVVHHGYTNNFAGTMTSQLFAIDSTLNILVSQMNNDGFLDTVGPLGIGVDVTDVGGFDISAGNEAFAAFSSVGGSASLYRIDLGSGAATSLGALTGTVVGLAVVPEPSSFVLLGLGALGLVARRRRA